VIRTLWNHVKINYLQDKVDRRAVRANDNPAPWVLRGTGFFSYDADIGFAPLFGTETVYFTQLPEIVTDWFTMPPDPIEPFGTLQRSTPSTSNPPLSTPTPHT